MAKTVIDEVTEERWRQDAQWGGNAIDDTRDRGDWQNFIRKQNGLANREGKDGAGWRDRMIKIAALAIAAVQADDRKNGQAPAVDAVAKDTACECAIPQGYGVRHHCRRCGGRL